MFRISFIGPFQDGAGMKYSVSRDTRSKSLNTDVAFRTKKETSLTAPTTVLVIDDVWSAELDEISSVVAIDLCDGLDSVDATKNNNAYCLTFNCGCFLQQNNNFRKTSKMVIFSHHPS